MGARGHVQYMSPPQDGSVLMGRQNGKWIEAGGGRKCEVTSRNMRWPGLADLHGASADF